MVSSAKSFRLSNWLVTARNLRAGWSVRYESTNSENCVPLLVDAFPFYEGQEHILRRMASRFAVIF